MTDLTPLPSHNGRFAWLASTGFRLFTVACVAILLLIPLLAVRYVVKTRAADDLQQIQSVAQTWGTQQTVIGPILVLPYIEHLTSIGTVTDANGENRVASKDIYNDHTALLLPQNLDIRADIKPEQHAVTDKTTQALVYQANLSISGTFDHEALLKAGKGERKAQWDKAFVAIGISDTKAIDENAALTWDAAHLSLTPGTQLPELLNGGVHVPLLTNASNANKHEFKLTMNLRGSNSLLFAPVGEASKMRLTSTWMQPQFLGNILPDKQTITDQGFNAEWKISPLARDYPQGWDADDKTKPNLAQLTVGVELIPLSSLYQNILKLLPYSVLALAMIFLSLLAFDSKRTRARLNALQYGVLGTLFALFYLLLMTLGEQLAFLHAYAAAATVTVVLMTIYLAWLLKRGWQTLSLFSLLTLFYAGLYALLIYPQFALMSVVGICTFLVILLMYISYQASQHAYAIRY